jgi:hypothetical protein
MAMKKAAKTPVPKKLRLDSETLRNLTKQEDLILVFGGWVPPCTHSNTAC